MLKGDLSATPLADVLRGLAEQSATGCLHIDDGSGDEALVYLKAGRVYSAYVPGRRPQLGARLISSGALAPEALAEALEAQETELQGWRLGELLVHLGYVDRPVVEAFVLEQLREATFDLSRWPSGRFRFRKNEKTREDVGSHAEVADLLAEVERRREHWDAISGVVHGPNAVPVLSAGGLASAELTLDQDEWALLCKVDGDRTVAQLARDCGFTTFEAGQIVYALANAGLLQVEETLEEPEPDVDEDLAPLGAALASAFAEPRNEASRLADVFADDDNWTAESEISRLLAPSTEPAAEPVAEPVALTSELASLTAALADLPPMPTLEPAAPPLAAFPPAADDPFGDSLSRVSHALNALLGESLPPKAMPEPPAPTGPSPAELAAQQAEAERLERMREAAAAELAQAHAMAEASRSDAGRRVADEAARTDAEQRAAEDAVRIEAERLAAEEAARIEAERLVAEEAARAAEEAERRAAEEAARIEAERQAAEEAARLEAERLAAEEAARIEAERAAAEEAARAAEEAARLEAERLAAEEAARADAERQAAEEAARIEAERQAAEEAARAEAERQAAEEAARAEAERQAAEEAARAEAERRATEEAARLEVERLAAEEAARAAEEAARAEADRLAAEAERLAAEEDARAAEHAARLAAEQAAADEAARRQRYAAEEAARADAEHAAAVAEAAAAEAARLVPEPAPVPVLAPAASTLDAAAMFRDLNAQPVAADTVETLEEYAVTAPAPAAPAPANGNGGSRSGLSETAALLRELTSLGLDDEPAAPAGAAANAASKPQAAPPKEQPKKRKGLFGR